MVALLQCVLRLNDTAPTEFYTLSLHDALPILVGAAGGERVQVGPGGLVHGRARVGGQLQDLPGAFVGVGGRRQVQRSNRQDRKSTRLNSSHVSISYAVFCLKKKKKELQTQQQL